MSGKRYPEDELRDRLLRDYGGCGCPTSDPVDCVQIRYNMVREDALIERCECVCHEKWQAEMDGINRAFEWPPDNEANDRYARGEGEP